MKPRPKSCRHALAAHLQAQQEDRLMRIAGGKLEPGCERERLFLKRARRAGQVRIADYLLPAGLYLRELGANGPGPDDDPIFS
jgi:hypothetical protein